MVILSDNPLKIDPKKIKEINVVETIKEGDWFSINGSTGEVIKGPQPLVEPEFSGEFATFMGWVDQFSLMKVALV